jgi:hypothetical protein
LLGVFKTNSGILTSNNDLNNKPQGYWNCNGTQGFPSGIPTGVASAFHFLGFGGGESINWGIQMLFTSGDTFYMYVRVHVSSTFYQWKKVTLT